MDGDRDGALDRLIRARSVAIVGASERPGASSGFVVRNLLAQGYGGRIVPVHRTAPTVFGLPAVARLADMDVLPDAVLVGLPADDVAPVLEEAGGLGVRAAVVLASGFAETGPAGAARQDRLRAVASRHGMAVCGPNCLGLFETRTGLALYSSRIAPMRVGGVAVLSHSGALAIALAQSGRIGVSLLVSAGNAAVTDIPDYLRYTAADPATTVAMVVVEGIADPAAFSAGVAAMHATGKPVVVLRAGRSSRGAEASAAHTGALAGSDAAFIAFFERIGAVFATDLEGALQAAALLSAPAIRAAGPPRSAGLALVGVSGGGMAHASDLAEEAGLCLPSLAPETTDRLRAILPAFATPQNPLDLTGIVFGDPAVYAAALAALAADPSVGAICAIQDVPAGLDPEGAGEYAGIAGALAAFSATTAIPFVVLSHLAAMHETIAAQLASADVPRVGGGRAGLAALKAVLAPPRAADAGPPPVVDALPEWVGRFRQGPVSERDAKLFLAAHGLPVTREGAAATAEAAVALAMTIGFPVALKVDSPDIPHKTEAGGVRLGLPDAQAVRVAFAEILRDAHRHAPQARIDGVLVQEMVQGGVEALVGTTRDTTFGPVVLVGAGGILVELVRDGRIGLLPLGEAGARSLLQGTRLPPLLAGWRGAPACDEDALVDLVARLGAVAMAYRYVVEAIDLNPVVVLPHGRGVRIVDALVVPRLAHGSPAR
ncbi:MAG: acetate--CoA ligase family protein [Burkholderiales bacterium]|nr:acetate--CoA ligase family protein [Burkholderiales bacterium]